MLNLGVEVPPKYFGVEWGGYFIVTCDVASPAYAWLLACIYFVNARCAEVGGSLEGWGAYQGVPPLQDAGKTDWRCRREMANLHMRVVEGNSKKWGREKTQVIILTKTT